MLLDLCEIVSFFLYVSAQAVLSELEAMSVRVDGARDQAVILMTGRGPACRDVVEPKLEDLNRNFHKVAQHIKTAQVTHYGFVEV